MCRRNLFHYDLRVCTELQVLSKTVSRLWFYSYNKYKNGTLQDVQPYNITSGRPYGGSDNFSPGISGKLQK